MKSSRAISIVGLSVALTFLAGCEFDDFDIAVCPSGRMCRPGDKCAAKQDICIQDKCGNGVLDPNEVCDDGNIIDGDGCSRDCTSKEVCGNGIVDKAAGEQCDPPNPGHGCNASCKTEGCGNGLLDPGEDCDNGPNTTGAYNQTKESAQCDTDCTFARHGDGKVNSAFGEQCDGDDRGSGNGVNCESATCNSDCTPSKHGDGKVNPSAGEQCDGNDLGLGNGHDCESDICNYNCSLSKCGDGIVNPSAGEECDRDGTVGHDGQRGTDGHSATCTPDCKRSTCGDKYVNTLAGEECDLGNGKNSDSGDCMASCKVASCGDGHTNTTLDAYGKPKEECDNGASNSDTGPCLTNCRAAACGDGHVQTGVEECDVGPDSASVKTECDYGLGTCKLCSRCKWANLTGPRCGDGTKDEKHGEACDLGPSNGATVCPYNFKNPTKPGTCDLCTADCKTASTGALTYCGDGIKNGNEACDDGPNNGKTSCPTYGMKNCSICNADCSKATTYRGRICGDGVPDPEEKCDAASSFACGTCGAPGTANECKLVSATSSTGTITIVSPSRLTGVTIQLDDGVSAGSPKMLEFINGGQAHPGNIAVDLSSGSGTADAATIAQRIVTALSTVSSPFTIVATAPLDSATVSMANSAAGLFGNHQIVVKPGNTSAITTTGMAGGNGCPLGQMCASNDDCARGSCPNDTPPVCK